MVEVVCSRAGALLLKNSEVWGEPLKEKPFFFSNMIPGCWPGSLMVKQQTYTLYYRQISEQCRFDSCPG